MDHVILDGGLDTNVVPKQTWEWMGRHTLQWSPIQLRMENQQKIIPMGRLQGVTIDIEGASVLADFEVIEIVDDNNPYLVLLGNDWATDMNRLIKLKKGKMIFEKKFLCIIVPLDLVEGSRYTEPVRDYESDDDLDCIYKIKMRDQDWVNPTVDGRITWDCESSYTLDSDEELERWKNWLHEVTTLSYNMMTQLLHCVLSEVRNMPTYDGLNDVDIFFGCIRGGGTKEAELPGFGLHTACYARKVVGYKQG